MSKVDEDVLFSQRVIDNRKVSMKAALNSLLNRPETAHFSTAVGYFYISGLLLIKDTFKQFMDKRNGQMRILMGNETNQKTAQLLAGSVTDQEYLEKLPSLVRDDIASVDDTEFLQDFVLWLQQGRIAAKVYTGDANYFHAKSYLFFNRADSPDGKAIVGSSNFSRNGLMGNTELNVLSMDNFNALRNWFDSIWDSEEVREFSPELIKAVQSKLPQVLAASQYKPVTETYYDYANIFAKPYSDLNTGADWVKSLYPHQQHGVTEIEDKLNTFGTAVLADGVGLGKTRTAAGIIRMEIKYHNCRQVLIIADKKLNDQWREELAVVGITAKSYQQITREKFTYLGKADLDQIAANIDLVIIDEAHLGLKNRKSQAYRKLQYVFDQSHERIKGLLLTATPWNNSREDVLNLGSLFLRTDQIPADRAYHDFFLFGNTTKVIKKLETDDQAFNEFWSDIFLQRTRRTYGGKEITFAKRKFPTVDIKYDPNKNQLFQNNFDLVANLSFPYMDPLRYLMQHRPELASERWRMTMLKRADSSWRAYESSINRTIGNLKTFTTKLNRIQKDPHMLRQFQRYLSDKYKLSDVIDNTNAIAQIFGEDTDDSDIEAGMLPFQQESQHQRLKYYNNIAKRIDAITPVRAKKAIRDMTRDANVDLSVLEPLLQNLQKAYSNRDEKYLAVVQAIQAELVKGHKVILISEFRTTANYYYNLLIKEAGLEANKIGLVTGGDVDNKVGTQSFSKRGILERFAPRAKNRPDLVGSEDELNILVGTDTISTGQNLQDAVVLMNLDLPYNPMILEQRIGRIDRPHSLGGDDRIFIYTFPVYEAIDAELKMSERLGKKLKGVFKDTQFDDMVLPEYAEYLRTAAKEKGSAVQKMVDTTVEKNVYNGAPQSEAHSEQYREANRRMYDFKVRNVRRLENPLYPVFSFSRGKTDGIVVVQLAFKDVNGASLSNENVVIDLANPEDHTVSNGERNLYASLEQGIRTANDLSKNKAAILIGQATEIVHRFKPRAVAAYNRGRAQASTAMAGVKDKLAVTTARQLMDSVNDPANQHMILNQVNEAGVDPKTIGSFIRNIETIGPDDDQYDYVHDIHEDINSFWLHFDVFAKLFDVDNIQISKGARMKKIDTRLADVDHSQATIILGNLVVVS